MSKQDYIPQIHDAIGDSGLSLPPSFDAANLEYNGVSGVLYEQWLTSVNRILLSFKTNGYFYMLPEGILGSLRDNIQNIVNNNPSFPGQRDQIFTSLVGFLEQITQIITPYANLADQAGYKELESQTRSLKANFEEFINSSKEETVQQNTRINNVSIEAEKLLGNVSSGTLSEKFKYLSDQRWHSIITVGAGFLTAYSVGMLIVKSNEIVNYVIDKGGDVKTSVLLAKLVFSLPYLAIFIFSVLEFRRRIALRDQLFFKKEVASALEAYTELLITKTQDIKGENAQDQARQQVLEFLSAAILELTRTPDGKPSSTGIGAKFKDIGLEVEQ